MKTKPTTRYEHRGTDTTRIKALSDGLFAIVLTLLVLELKPPETTQTGQEPVSVAYLASLWPELFSFVLTFVVGGIYWMAHHWDFEHITGYSRQLMWVNLTFLLSVSILPFTTALIGSQTEITSWSLYCANIILIGVTLTALWGYCLSAGLVDPSLDDRLARFMIGLHLTTPAVFVLSMIVAQVALELAMYMPLLISVLRPLELRFLLGERVESSRDQGQGGGGSWQEWLWRGMGFAPIIAFGAWTIWLWLNHLL